MKKSLIMIAVVMLALVASCNKEKGLYPQENKYLPVVLQGSTKWSIINVETGELVVKDAFVNSPSPVVDDMFWVYNDKNRVDIYNIADCKKPVNKEAYGSATCFGDGHAIVSKPGEPLQVIDKQCNTVAKLSPSFRSATMFNNGRALINTDLERFGFIDVKGDTVIKPNLTWANAFVEDNVTLVSFSEINDSSRVITIIDKNGKKLYDLDTEKYQPLIPNYKMGVLPVINKKDSMVFLDRHGKETANPLEAPKKVKNANYRDIRTVGEGRFIAIKGDRMGVVDKENNVLIPFNYQMLLNLSPTRFIAGKDSVLMLIDEKGKQVGKHKFANVQAFSPESQAVRGYIDVEITAATLLSFIEEDMAAGAKTGSTLMDLNQLVGVNPEQYIGLKQITRPIPPLIYSYIFDSEIASPGGATTKPDSIKAPTLAPNLPTKPGDSTAMAMASTASSAHFNYSAKLNQVQFNFPVLECAPGTEERMCELMTRAMGSKGFKLNPDGTFVSDNGTGVAMGYEEGVFRLFYYFDATQLKPLPRKSRTN
ncbi:MAG: WG repeat-containing protein [Muribaculaceae bacterium]|nr:WG repeat-containing protein [Muribaculaceae bacterium]